MTAGDEREPVLEEPRLEANPRPEDLLHPVDQRPPTLIYQYRDRRRQLLYPVARYEDPKDFRPWRPDGAGFVPGYPEQRVPYRLPELAGALLADPNQIIYVCEGERDADAVWAAGAAATCAAGGALAWHPDDRERYAETLQQAGVWRVRIVAHRDPAGLSYARNVLASLGSVGIAAPEVEIVQTPLEHEGADAADHLASGRTLEELVPLQLRPSPHDGDTSPVVFAALREFLHMPFVPAESLVGLPRGGTNLLPRYGWVLVWGPAGCGKTSIVADLVFYGAAGRPWQGYSIARPLRFVVVVNEGVPGGLQDKFAEKLEVWDGDDEERTRILDGIALYASPWGEFTLRAERMRNHLRDYAHDFEADYIVLDPLHTVGTTGAGTPQETEEFKHLLRMLGLWDSLGWITPHHANKMGMVSGDWGRQCDTLIRLEKDGQRPATKWTLQKARPADPHELNAVRILEWVVETKGYRFHESAGASSSSSDEKVRERVLQWLEANPGWHSTTTVRKAVRGDDKAIDRALRDLFETGDFALSVGETLQDPETVGDLEFTEWHRLKRPKHWRASSHAGLQSVIPVAPTSTVSTPVPPEEAAVGESVRPPKGAPNVHRPTDRGSEPNPEADREVDDGAGT